MSRAIRTQLALLSPRGTPVSFRVHFKTERASFPYLSVDDRSADGLTMAGTLRLITRDSNDSKGKCGRSWKGTGNAAFRMSL